MFLKFVFDRTAALFGLLVLWPVLLVVVILIKIKMPGGPAFFCQKRVGKDGKLFTCHKFRTMTVNHNGSTVSVAGDCRITPLGAKLRHYKIDELPGLWYDGLMKGVKMANIPDVVLKFRMTDSLFKKRRNGWAFAKKQLTDRLQINRDLHYGFGANVFAYAMFCLLVSPAWKKIAYRVFR